MVIPNEADRNVNSSLFASLKIIIKIMIATDVIPLTLKTFVVVIIIFIGLNVRNYWVSNYFPSLFDNRTIIICKTTKWDDEVLLS